MNSRILRKPHVAAAITYVVAVAAFAVQTGGMNLRSLIVPLICMGIMVGTAVTSLTLRDQADNELSTNAKEVITLVATVAYAVLIYGIGFYAASFVYAIFIFVHVSGLTKRTAGIAVVNALGIVLAVYAIFNLFLDYFIPEGMLAEYLM